MSTQQHILNDAAVAKDYIFNSQLPEERKQLYLRLINTSTIATNGIKPDQKIQMMTECIQGLIISQCMHLSDIDKKIHSAIQAANTKQCNGCKAMQHAVEVEQEQHNKELFDNYMEKLGVNPDDKNIIIPTQQNIPQNNQQNVEIKKDWMDVVKEILLKPYIYVVICLMSISPHGVEILKTLLAFFNN